LHKLHKRRNNNRLTGDFLIPKKDSMTVQINTITTIGDITPLLESQGMAVTYESVLVRNNLDASIGYIGLVGMPESVTSVILDSLGIDPEDSERASVTQMIDKASLNDEGLYVVNTTQADTAQSILGGRRLVHPNGLARIICEEYAGVPATPPIKHSKRAR
jgi:hypothetical protein